MEVSFESRKKPICNSFSTALWVSKFWMEKNHIFMNANIFFGVLCIRHGSCLSLFIICFASEQTSCLNEADRIDLPGFFSIPCSHEASKECTMFHVVLMNGATPARSSVPCLFLTSVFLQAENISHLSSPGTRRHVGANLSSVFSLWQCSHAHQQPRPWVSDGPLPYNHLVILYRHLQAIRMGKFGLRRDQPHSYVKPRGFWLLWAVARYNFHHFLLARLYGNTKGIGMAEGVDQRQKLSEAIYFSAQKLIIFTTHYTEAKDPCVLQPVTSFNTLKQNGRHTSASPRAQFHISESIRQECLSNAALSRRTSTSSRSDLALRHCKTICLPHQSKAHFRFSSLFICMQKHVVSAHWFYSFGQAKNQANLAGIKPFYLNVRTDLCRKFHFERVSEVC